MFYAMELIDAEHKNILPTVRDLWIQQVKTRT